MGTANQRERVEDDGAEVGDGEVAKMSKKDRDEARIVRENWDRYVYVSERGHYEYCQRARRLEDLYVGGGKQWRDADRATMEEEGRYPIEINEVMDTVNTALGYQINNRVDIAASPKKDTSEEKAQQFSKVLMKVKDDLHYGHYESEMFADGLIQQRGYIDLRVAYDENLNGEPSLFIYDPMDVIPDPDAKSYDPDDWADVTVTRWMTGDDIEADYGPEKRAEIEADYGTGMGEEDFGDSLNEEARNRFGDDLENGGFDAVELASNIPRYRVIDRQYWKIAPTLVAVFPTGDVRTIENSNPLSVKQAKADGAMILRMPRKRVRWVVSTENVLLHNDWSPYDHFTVIPFFPVFRRGITRGMVDNLEGPQELLNSTVSTTNQIVRGTANSGWSVEENSLTNMDTEDLETEGAKNGLVLEYAKNSKPPEKIKPNPVPDGMVDLTNFASSKITRVSGISDAARGAGGKTQSGLALQSQQFASQLSGSKTLENLAFTRRLFAQRLTKILQQTMTEAQVVKITETTALGEKVTEKLYVNQPHPETGEFFDITSGEYDYAITDQPTQVTFQNNQFSQAMEMKEKGVPIPPHVLVKHSNLNDKQAIIQEMAASQENPEAEAKAMLMKAQSMLAEANAITKNVEALFSAARTASVIAANPALATAADAIAKSAGFVDKDEAPIYPAIAPAVAGGVTPVPTNTNPLTPDNPQAGATTGIESGDPAGAA